MTPAYRNLARFFLFLRVGVLCLFALLLNCAAANCQAAAETAGATSVSAATAASSAKTPTVPGTPASTNQGGPTHLIASSGPPAEVKNRQELEQKAGFDAGKLLIRSVPSGANVWVDGAYVGKTPMLLILAPGKYHVQLRDQRQDYAESKVDLLPKETREFAPTLTVRYPVRATVR
jgi:PEGA domain